MSYFRIFAYFIFYILWLIKEIYLSGLYLIKLIVSKRKHYEVIEFVDCDFNHSWLKILYAISITLTPGTTTLYIEKNKLCIYAIDKELILSLKEGCMYKKIYNLQI